MLRFARFIQDFSKSQKKDLVQYFLILHAICDFEKMHQNSNCSSEGMSRWDKRIWYIFLRSRPYVMPILFFAFKVWNFSHPVWSQDRILLSLSFYQVVIRQKISKILEILLIYKFSTKLKEQWTSSEYRWSKSWLTWANPLLSPVVIWQKY